MRRAYRNQPVWSPPRRHRPADADANSRPRRIAVLGGPYGVVVGPMVVTASEPWHNKVPAKSWARAGNDALVVSDLLQRSEGCLRGPGGCGNWDLPAYLTYAPPQSSRAMRESSSAEESTGPSIGSSLTVDDLVGPTTVTLSVRRVQGRWR